MQHSIELIKNPHNDQYVDYHQPAAFKENEESGVESFFFSSTRATTYQDSKREITEAKKRNREWRQWNNSIASARNYSKSNADELKALRHLEQKEAGLVFVLDDDDSDDDDDDDDNHDKDNECGQIKEKNVASFNVSEKCDKDRKRLRIVSSVVFSFTVIFVLGIIFKNSNHTIEQTKNEPYVVAFTDTFKSLNRHRHGLTPNCTNTMDVKIGTVVKCALENIKSTSGILQCETLCSCGKCCFDKSAMSECYNNNKEWCEGFRACGNLGHGWVSERGNLGN